jgi:hypothetical protein
MRLVFDPVPDNPLVLQYTLLHPNGIRSVTGLRGPHTEHIEKWCKEQNCGTFLQYENPGFMYHIKFENTEKLAFFLLRWK